MRWLQIERRHFWVKGFKFAWKPTRVYFDQDQKVQGWVWLERYGYAERWLGNSWGDFQFYCFDVLAQPHCDSAANRTV